MPTPATSLAQRERGSLCDLLTELGPDVPTLCEGWRSADLAAHLYVRDRRPDAMPGMAVTLGPATTWSERVRRGARDTIAWDALVAGVRNGPPKLLKPADRAINTVEYFVHHEDLRRAQSGWEPRQLTPDDEAELWRRVGFVKAQERLASLLPGHKPSAVRLEADGLEPLVIAKGPGNVVKGRAGEIVLWLLGRKQASRAEVEVEVEVKVENS